MKSAVRVVTLLWVLSSVQGFDVPEPSFEAFHPSGLRVSIPDIEGIQSVQFLLNVRSHHEDAEELFHDTEKMENGRWTYWNPNVTLQKDDQVYYKLTVEFDDLYWDKEGKHTIDKVFMLNGGPPLIQPMFSGLPKFHHEHLFRAHNGLRGVHKPLDRTITKSSMYSSTGTFHMKPNGEVEASGHKKSESYDSTKREGEQWEMSESEMTAEELEELKRFIGPSFRSFAELTSGQVEEFKRLHGSNFHIPERLRSPLEDNLHPTGTHSYEQSYFAKESTSSVRNQAADYARQPSGYHHFHDRQSLHESSTGRLNPGYSHVTDPRPASSSNQYEQRRYTHQSSSTVSHPVPLAHTAAENDDDYQQTIPAALPSRSSSRYNSYPRTESHRVAATQTATRTVTNPSPSYITDEEEERRSLSSASHHLDYNSDVQIVEKPKYKVESHYTGSIFRFVTTSQSKSPQECSVWSETNYDHVTDLREIQKSISKLTCLAALEENYVKEELRLVKQQNTELSRRLESLEREFRNYQNTCKCSG